MKFLLLFLASIVPATLLADFPKAWQFGFQDPATDLMGKVISLHNGISIVMAGVTLFVLILLNQETLPAFLEKIFRLHPIEQ